MQKPYNINHLQELAHKWKKGVITAEELQEFNTWFNARPDQLLELPENYAGSPLSIRDKVHRQLMERVAQSRMVKTRVYRLWPKIAAAAAGVALVFGVWFFSAQYRNGRHSGPVSGSQFANDIKPGTNKATLTLGNGKVINLSNAKTGVVVGEDLTYNDGTSVSSSRQSVATRDLTPSVEMTLSTPRGGIYQITLSDGTKVWLNAASSLTYSATLIQHGVRRVKLEGEAYFEVFKDNAHSFIVESNGQEVEVLGTHFNVNAYHDEPTINTTLLEGAVKVTSGVNKQIIKPGEQAINNGNSIKVSKANIENVTDWKEGDFSMNRVNFKTAMRKIARWYDVEIVFDPSFPEDIESGGWVSRNNKLSVVLKLIESSGQVHFKVEGKKIYVSR